MPTEIIKTINKCRICGSKNFTKYFDFGMMPLANHLIDIRNRNKKEDKFPLEVLFCRNCSLSQLSIIVNPKVLYNYYPYRSSVSNSFRTHCLGMVQSLAEKSWIKKKEIVVDIASNDGCLLEEFKKMGFYTIGIEPAINLAKISSSKGIEIYNCIWNSKVADDVFKKHGKVKVITATNVFAHVDDLKDFLDGVYMLLDDNGVFVVEVPYMVDLVADCKFDTIYHEHLSYFLIRPLQLLFKKNHFKIILIEKFEIHGGTVRIYAAKDTSKISVNKKSINDFISLERKKGMYALDTYKNLEKKAKSIKNSLISIISKLKKEGKNLAAYGASAKGNILLNYCGIDDYMIEAIIDDTLEKQNHLAPGNKIRIVDSSVLSNRHFDYLLILAWNFAQEIMDKTKEFKKNGGHYIIPIPEVKIV